MIYEAFGTRDSTVGGVRYCKRSARKSDTRSKYGEVRVVGFESPIIKGITKTNGPRELKSFRLKRRPRFAVMLGKRMVCQTS